MQNVEKDLFSKETLLQHLPNADDREYLKFDCNNKAEGKCFCHGCENKTILEKTKIYCFLFLTKEIIKTSIGVLQIKSKKS